MLNGLRRRIRAIFFRSRLEDELNSELRFHLEREVEQNIAKGMRPDEARSAAMRSFGGLDRVKEDSRDVRGVRLLEECWQDLRYGFRMLRKSKGFTAVAVLSLALGVGANTALFSVMDAVLLKALPVKEPERLSVFEWYAGPSFRFGGMSGSSYTFSPPGTEGLSLFRHEVFEKMRRARAASAESPLSDLFAFAPIDEINAAPGGHAEIVKGQVVSGGYYAGLGTPPVLGRAISDEDDRPGAPPVVVLSHQFWRERFEANPAVIGQELKLNKQSFTIIGVTGPGFTAPLQVGFYPAVTVPIACEGLLRGENSGLGASNSGGSWWLDLMGRLKPGATYEQARDSLSGVFQTAALEAMPPPRANQRAEVDPKDYPRLVAQSGARGMLDDRRLHAPMIYGLFIVVALVLLIACANVANLLLARAALRGPEISVRLAVGAGRWRLIRQLLTESVLLACIGGLVGVVFAVWCKTALLAMIDKDIRFLPADVDISLNWRALFFTGAVSLLIGLLFGMAPAWRATSHDLTTSLKQSRRATGSVSRLSKGLIITQVALSLLLLAGAGLFIRSLYNLQRVDLGFNQQNLLLFKLQPEQGGYKDQRLFQFYQRLFERLDHLPGVRAATFARVPLIARENTVNGVWLPGDDEKTAGRRPCKRQTARENYFSTMEIPLLRGRGFTSQDDENAPYVAVVNQAFVRNYFPSEDALGKRITIRYNRRVFEIIGVAADAKYRNQRDEIAPLVYTNWRQEGPDIGKMYFALRTMGEPTSLTDAARQAVRELDDSLPVTEVITQEARTQATLGQERLSARLLSFFGGLALLLAAIGLSGVLAYSVAQRTHEIGVRMALGAETRNVLSLVIWQGMKLTLIGLTVGAAVGYALKRLFESGSHSLDAWRLQFGDQLYGVSVADPWTFGVIAGLLTLTALAACYIPARRATKVDPMIVLRAE